MASTPTKSPRSPGLKWLASRPCLSAISSAVARCPSIHPKCLARGLDRIDRRANCARLDAESRDLSDIVDVASQVANVDGAVNALG